MASFGRFVFVPLALIVVKNSPILRIFDPALPHTITNPSPPPPCIAHNGAKVNLGSFTVRAQGKSIARVGDSFDMGTMIDGSNTVRAG